MRSWLSCGTRKKKRLKQENLQAKKERLVQHGILNELQPFDCLLPKATREQLLKRTQPHLVYKGFFDWQKKELATALKQLGIPFKQQDLKRLVRSRSLDDKRIINTSPSISTSSSRKRNDNSRIWVSDTLGTWLATNLALRSFFVSLAPMRFTLI